MKPAPASNAQKLAKHRAGVARRLDAIDQKVDRLVALLADRGPPDRQLPELPNVPEVPQQ
jgi:hypothetical protein